MASNAFSRGAYNFCTVLYFIRNSCLRKYYATSTVTIFDLIRLFSDFFRINLLVELILTFNLYYAQNTSS
jgi:hypothetical protein